MTPEVERLVRAAARITTRCRPPASLPPAAYLTEHIRAEEIRELDEAARAVLSLASGGSPPVSSEDRPSESRIRASAEECAPGDLYPLENRPGRENTFGTRCAGCGKFYSLHRLHQVHLTGEVPTVTPSLHCRCGAHYLVHEGRIEWC